MKKIAIFLTVILLSTSCNGKGKKFSLEFDEEGNVTKSYKDKF